jgi:hypothetical protein
MRLARLESHAHRLTRSEQVVLADHLVERAGAQSFGQRGMAGSRAVIGARLGVRPPVGVLWQVEGQVVLHGEIVAAWRANIESQKNDSLMKVNTDLNLSRQAHP